MILQAKLKKILEPGIHLATIKNISVVKDAKGNPASWIDPATGQPTGSLRVLFMGKNGYGIEYDFWLGKAHLKKLTALTDALQLKTLPVHKDDLIGRKVFVMVFQVLFFDGPGLPRLDATGKHVSMPKLMPRFWIASANQPPVVDGNPMDNGGVPSGDFLWHWCDGKYFLPNIVQPEINQFLGKTLENVTKQISRPVGAHEQRMKSRCEELERQNFVWDGGLSYTSTDGIQVPVSALVTNTDETFRSTMNAIFEERKKDRGVETVTSTEQKEERFGE